MNEPDCCVVPGPARNDLVQHPGPAELVLVVEVADSSLVDDRELGTRVYGPAGLPAYWIVDLVDRRVEVHTGPGPAGRPLRPDPPARLPTVGRVKSVGSRPAGRSGCRWFRVAGFSLHSRFPVVPQAD